MFPTLLGLSLSLAPSAISVLVLCRSRPPPLQLKRLYNHLDIGVRFAGLSFNVVECSTQVG